MIKVNTQNRFSLLFLARHAIRSATDDFCGKPGQGRVIVKNFFNTGGFGGKIQCPSTIAEDDIQVEFIKLHICNDITCHQLCQDACFKQFRDDASGPCDHYGTGSPFPATGIHEFINSLLGSHIRFED